MGEEHGYNSGGGGGGQFRGAALPLGVGRSQPVPTTLWPWDVRRQTLGPERIEA